MDSIQSYGCCTDTVAACLKNTDHACRTPALWANEICRLAKKGNALKDIKDAAEKRKNAMDPSAKVYPIEVLPEHIWGNPEAKVILSIYLCGRCPYCSRHVPAMLRAIESAGLKDKLAVNLRLFPIKTHDHSTEAALAIEAAAKMGQAWPYIIRIILISFCN
jgi:protein-disulfide isomerase